jgi:hypothetical protein
MTPKNKWYHWVMVVGVLCVLGTPCRAYSSDRDRAHSDDRDRIQRHRPEILGVLHVMPGVPEFQFRRIHQEQTSASISTPSARPLIKTLIPLRGRT